MDKNKIKIILGCLILVAAIILRLVLYSNNSTQDDSKSNIKYFFIDNYVAFSYKNNGIKYLSYEDGEILKNKFNVYSDGNYLGNYYVRKLSSGLKLLDDNNDFINYDGYLVGSSYYDSTRVSKLNIDSNILDASSYANDILKQEGIFTSYDTQTSSFLRYSADFNGDGLDEYIYILSSNPLTNDTGYSIMFTRKNNEYKVISKEIDKINEGYQLTIVGILDINNDNQLDIVVAKSKFGHDIECYEIYKSNNMNFKLLKGCE